MDTAILEDLGLTNAEIKVYLALLELGTSTAGPLLAKTDLQNSVVHRTLHSLIEKGLINYVMEGRRHCYQATDPENFYAFIEEKKQRFAQLLPELKVRQQFVQQKETATVFKGIRGIKEVYRQLRENPGKEYLSFGGSAEVTATLGTVWWRNHHLKRVQQKMPARQIFDATVQWLGEEFNKRLPLTEIRFLSQEFAQLTETVIVEDLVAISVFVGTPYALLIKDRLVADGYRKHFELMWKEAGDREKGKRKRERKGKV